MRKWRRQKARRGEAKEEEKGSFDSTTNFASRKSQKDGRDRKMIGSPEGSGDGKGLYGSTFVV